MRGRPPEVFQKTERIVKVWDNWDKPYTISVHRRSKCVWEAVGDCLGALISVEARSESAAIKRWCEAAHDSGN